jgi:putative FmdB family regulatory protein
MPLYQYHCDKCGQDFENINSMALCSEASVCECGAVAERRYTPAHIRKYNTPFVKDGKGFESVWMREDEFQSRLKGQGLGR